VFSDKMENENLDIKPMEKLLRGRMTMKEFSRRSGIPYRTIQSYNARVSEPLLSTAVLMAKELNCSLIEVAEAFDFDVKGLPYA
jgi:predicted transcriptional regulator